MLKNLLYYVLILLSFSVNSQTFQWLNTSPLTFSSNVQNISYTVTTDLSGNVYMMGYKSTPYPNGEILGNQFYNKYDSTGALLFANEITGHAAIYNAATDNLGNVVVTLGYIGTITIGNFSLGNNSETNIKFALVKLDSLGTALWSYQLTMTEYEIVEANGLDVDASNNIYVGYGNFINSIVEKISPSGTTVFTIYQNTVENVNSISVDNEGNIYAAGSCAKPAATFGNTSFAPPPSFLYNSYVAKYSPTGNFQWVKFVNDITCSKSQVKARTPDAVYFTSRLFDNYSFDAITSEGPSGAGSDFFLTKLNSSGDFQWMREVPNEIQSSGIQSLAYGKRNTLEVDNLDNVYFGGNTEGIINWGNGVTSTTLGSYDVVVLKYNSDGLILMAKTAGGTNFDRVDCLKIATDGSIIVGGAIKGNGTFDNINITGETNETHPYVAKLSNENLSTANNKSLKVVLYPNPSADAVFILNTTESLKGWLFNIVGQKVKSFHLNPGQPLSVSELAKGTYFIKINGMKTMKFIKS